jgi:hypothetical protein
MTGCFFVSCEESEKPVSKEEALEFAKKIETSIYKKDEDFLNNAFDIKGMIKKMGFAKNESELNGFSKGIEKKMVLGTQIIAALNKKGIYQFVRQYEKEKVQHIIFRLFGDDGINYHDYQLAKPRGAVKIADLFIYLTGENISETFSNLMVQFPDFNSANKAKTDQVLEEFKQIAKIKKSILGFKYDEAKQLIDELPDSLRKNKIVQIYNLQVSSQLSDDKYNAAIQEYMQFYPDQPNMQLVLLDIYTNKKEYGKVMEAVNKLDSLLGHDPFLDFYRAHCSSYLNDKAGTRKYLERLNTALPLFENGALELIENYAETKEFNKAFPVINKLKKSRDFDTSGLSIYYTLYPKLRQ